MIDMHNIPVGFHFLVDFGVGVPGIDHRFQEVSGLGAEITTEETEEGRVITLTGQPELHPQEIVVPRDPSSAAFPVAAALIVPGRNLSPPINCQ